VQLFVTDFTTRETFVSGSEKFFISASAQVSAAARGNNPTNEVHCEIDASCQQQECHLALRAVPTYASCGKENLLPSESEKRAVS
jgi:hypothetical protein